MGPAPAPDVLDPELINAGNKPVTANPGASCFHHADSFAMVRGGHLDLCVLGAMAEPPTAISRTGRPGEPMPSLRSAGRWISSRRRRVVSSVRRHVLGAMDLVPGPTPDALLLHTGHVADQQIRARKSTKQSVSHPAATVSPMAVEKS